MNDTFVAALAAALQVGYRTCAGAPGIEYGDRVATVAQCDCPHALQATPYGSVGATGPFAVTVPPLSVGTRPLPEASRTASVPPPAS